MRTRKPTTSPSIIVRRSRIHGTGVYAKKDIRKGARIIEYVGERIGKKESERRSDAEYANHQKDPKNNGAVYLFEINKRWDIDGNVPWNTAKYINHSCDPNCEVEIVGERIWIEAARDIKRGEELAYNYGYDFDDYEDHPCRCGSARCMGYIMDEEHWPKLRRSLAQKRRWTA